MKKIIFLILILFNCQSVKVDTQKIIQIETDAVLDATQCEKMNSFDRQICMNGLALDYIKTLNSDTKVIRRDVLKENAESVYVQYTLQRHKLIIRFKVTEDKPNIVEKIWTHVAAAGAGSFFTVILIFAGGGK